MMKLQFVYEGPHGETVPTGYPIIDIESVCLDSIVYNALKKIPEYHRLIIAPVIG
jgi:hypothetical protein